MEVPEEKRLGILLDLREKCRSGRARQIRQRVDASLRSVAGAADISPSTISRWERGQMRPTGAAALRYARVLSLLEQKEAGR